MIILEQPSLCINAHDVPGPRYEMWGTVTNPRGVSVTQVVCQLIGAHTEAMLSRNTPLRHVVINACGSPGHIATAGLRDGIGICRHNVAAFSALGALPIGVIWLTSCLAAKGRRGRALCQALADCTNTLVVAATGGQKLDFWDEFRASGFGHRIDDFLGTVFVFAPHAAMRTGIDPHEVATAPG